MMTYNPEAVREYTTGLAKRLSYIETMGYTNPLLTASASIVLRYKGGFWDSRFTTHRSFQPGLVEALRETGVVPEIGQRSTSTRGNLDAYSFQLLAPIASYGNRSTFLRAAINAFGIDPGINVRGIGKTYPNGLWPSFWYSIGGNVLTDRVYGQEDEDEYRAGLLGLITARKFLLNGQSSSMPLSEMVLFATDNLGLVIDDNYKDIPDYQIAEESLRPVFGHLILRALTKHLGFLQHNALVPVERSFLN